MKSQYHFPMQSSLVKRHAFILLRAKQVGSPSKATHIASTTMSVGKILLGTNLEVGLALHNVFSYEIYFCFQQPSRPRKDFVIESLLNEFVLDVKEAKMTPGNQVSLFKGLQYFRFLGCQNGKYC